MRLLALATMAALVSCLLTACGDEVDPSAAPATASVTVSAKNCAPGWTAPPAGRTEFSVDNVGSRALRVQIVSGTQDGIYAEIYSLAPKVTRTLDTVLPDGLFQWRCITFGKAVDGGGSASTEQTVTGHTSLRPRVLDPLTSDEAEAAVLAYRGEINSGLEKLVSATKRLAIGVRSESIADAERLWLAAHLDYARLGAAYDTFGRFNGLIDGRADGLEGGVHSPDFTGFLRLEYGLWHHQPRRVLIGIADRLARNCGTLQKEFPSQRLNPSELPLRSHEILENTLQFELTGDTDEGSNTNLATAWANVEGTELVLKVLAPDLQARAPGVLRADERSLSALRSALVAYRHANGTWTPLQSLSTARRESLDALIDTALQSLARDPDLLQVQGQT